MLNRYRRLLLWWSQQKKDVNDVNLQFDNGQSDHGPPRGRGGHGRIGPLDPPLSVYVVVGFDAFSVFYQLDTYIAAEVQDRGTLSVNAFEFWHARMMTRICMAC